jgi:hypothetical protein
MMWFRGQYVPILYSSDPKGRFLSKDWVARGALQRIGAIIFGTVFFCGSSGLFFSSFVTRARIADATGGVLGQIFGTILALIAFLVACVGMLLTFRIARGVVRSFYK